MWTITALCLMRLSRESAKYPVHWRNCMAGYRPSNRDQMTTDDRRPTTNPQRPESLDTPYTLLYNCLRPCALPPFEEVSCEEPYLKNPAQKGSVRRRSSGVEQLFCKQPAVSSNLTVGSGN